jgi:ATP-dependent phosphofructokinase / diphosphate-dependent phosphofructokinase
VRLKTTARSHGRVMVVETMGRDAGWIALEGGLAGGADAILMPEFPFDVGQLALELQRRVAVQGYALVCVAEGARLGGNHPHWQQLPGGVARLGGVGDALVHLLGPLLPQLETRCTVLGHLQRGGAPTSFDRLLSTRFGVAAAACVRERVFGVTVALQGDRCVRVPLGRVAGQNRRVSAGDEMVLAARALGVFLGS